jgi:hypothetical protein
MEVGGWLTREREEVEVVEEEEEELQQEDLPATFCSWPCACVCVAEEGEEDIEKILASLAVKEAEKTAVVQRDAVEPPVRANCSVVRVGDEMVLFGGEGPLVHCL